MVGEPEVTVCQAKTGGLFTVVTVKNIFPSTPLKQLTESTWSNVMVGPVGLFMHAISENKHPLSSVTSIL